MLSIIISIVSILLGFVLLIKGAGFLVDGAAAIAKRLKISDLVIGLTIVAFGTSAPELVVSLISAAHGSSDLVLGNIIGSNLSNTLLILGVAAIIYPLTVKVGTSYREIPLCILATLALTILVNDFVLVGQPLSFLSRADGLILLLFFAIFLYYTFGISKVSGDTGEKLDLEKKQKTWKSIVLIIGGLIGLTVGGKLIVSGAVDIATLFGLSEYLIGLTILAIGTSLPELATAVVAALKKREEIAIGNILGSNIFNIFGILGITSLVSPVTFNTSLNFDVLLLLGVTVLLFLFMFIGKKHTLAKVEGSIFCLIYAAYIVFLVKRG